MLHLFRRGEGGARTGGEAGSVLSSHILPKFLKRLKSRERPYLLDLGQVSGSNIEFFARASCRVQVEDLLGEALREPEAVRPARPGGTSDGPAGGDAPNLVSARDAPDPAARAPVREAPGVPTSTDAGPRTVIVPPTRPGGRPTRRIVLPPRTFARPGAVGAPATVRSASGHAEPPPRRLPTTFSYPDETFDAVVAWDILNYYDAPTIRVVAAEVRRILKPGGLLLSYFHARQPQETDAPRRFRILDEKRVACDHPQSNPFRRHLYQNRDIEKLFAGLSIVELYFLKNSMREILMERKVAAAAARPLVRPATAKSSRFTIE